MVLTYPSPYLKDGVRLIDTPGVGSIYQHNTDVAYQYLAEIGCRALSPLRGPAHEQGGDWTS